MQQFVNGVRQERTGWRDERISRRHREWGAACTAVDIDFLLLEYHANAPAALIEYKAVGARWPDMSKGVYPALRTLSDCARIPFFLVFYEPTRWWFRLVPANDHAKRHFPYQVTLSEREYVSALYRLRGVSLPVDVYQRLGGYKP